MIVYYAHCYNLTLCLFTARYLDAKSVPGIGTKNMFVKLQSLRKYDWSSWCFMYVNKLHLILLLNLTY